VPAKNESVEDQLQEKNKSDKCTASWPNLCMNEDCLEVASLKNKNAVNYYDLCRTGNAPQLHHSVEFEENELQNIDPTDDNSVIGLEAYLFNWSR